MFNIIPLKDVLLNLNCNEELYQLFTCSYPRKRSILSNKSSKEKSSIVVQNVFILQSHVLVLVGDLQLIAFDQTPVVSPYDVDGKDLLSCSPNKITSVLDVFVDNQLLEYTFIISKSGELIVWTFKRPSFEWKYETTISLCKGKGSQLLSYTYDSQNKLLVWCEKVMVSQCCICSAEFEFNEGFALRNTRQLLHNCLPMSVYLLAQSTFCFISNILPGLMLLWCHSSGKITVRMWGDSFSTRSLPALTTDYQSITKGCISLWIDSPSSEIKFVAVASHPITRELVVLQQDLQVHLVTSNELEEVTSSHLCTLETMETDIFAKQVTGIYLINQLLLVLMSDGQINVFDVKYGLFLWKTESYVGTSPKVWVKKGMFPIIGIWNNLGIWAFNAKSILEQLKESQTKQDKESLEKHQYKTSALIDGCLLRRKVDIYKGISRNARTPLHYPFKILNNWNLSKLSTELALQETMKIKELLKDDIEALNINDIDCLLNQINDPVLLLTLFCDGDFQSLIKKKVVVKLSKLLKSVNKDNLDPSYLALFNEYLLLEEKITDCLSTHELSEHFCEDEEIFRKEFQNLLSLPNSEMQSDFVDKSLCFLFELNRSKFINILLNSLLPMQATGFHEVHEIDDDLYGLLYQAITRLDSSIFGLFWTALWDDSPKILLTLLNEICDKHPDLEIPIITNLFTMIYLPDSNGSGNLLADQGGGSGNLLADQVHIYCTLLLRLSPDDDDKACDIYLKYSFVEDAVKILQQNNNNSHKHKSLFHRLLVYTLEHKQFKSFVHYFCSCIPENFNIVSFNSLYMTYGCSTGTDNVFVKHPNDLDIISVTEMFRSLLSSES